MKRAPERRQTRSSCMSPFVWLLWRASALALRCSSFVRAVAHVHFLATHHGLKPRWRGHRPDLVTDLAAHRLSTPTFYMHSKRKRKIFAKNARSTRETATRKRSYHDLFPHRSLDDLYNRLPSALGRAAATCRWSAPFSHAAALKAAMRSAWLFSCPPWPGAP